MKKKLLKQIIKEAILVKIIGAVNEGYINNMATGIKGLFSKSEDVPKSVPKDVPKDDNHVQDISKIPETKTLWLLIDKKTRDNDNYAELTGSVYRGISISSDDIKEFNKIFENLLPQHMKLVLDFYKSFKEQGYEDVIENFEHIYAIRSASKGRH